jgi:hypothetical protein
MAASIFAFDKYLYCFMPDRRRTKFAVLLDKSESYVLCGDEDSCCNASGVYMRYCRSHGNTSFRQRGLNLYFLPFFSARFSFSDLAGFFLVSFFLSCDFAINTSSSNKI